MSLVLCSYFQDVLQSPLLSADDNEIQLNQDGSWSTHVEKNGVCSVESPQKPANAAGAAKVEVISLDVEVEASAQSSVQSNMLKMCLRPNGVEVEHAAVSNGEDVGLANGGTGEASNVTVDLTLSDSEDDQPQPNQKRPPLPKK